MKSNVGKPTGAISDIVSYVIIDREAREIMYLFLVRDLQSTSYEISYEISYEMISEMALRRLLRM